MVELVVDPLLQQIYNSICNLIKNTVNYNNEQIWKPEIAGSVGLIGLVNNVTTRADNQFIMIYRGGVQPFTKQQAAMTDWGSKELVKSTQLKIPISMQVVSTSDNPMGLSLETQWACLFSDSAINKILYPFSLWNDNNRFISLDPIIEEVDEGVQRITNRFRFVLMCSQEFRKDFKTYDKIITDLHQINK